MEQISIFFKKVMQLRHSNRLQYFNELANTAREYFIEYLNNHYNLSAKTRVLEIGCGEGGNLLPFAELGCIIKGIDISKTRIEQAKKFFLELNIKADFVCQNFITAKKPKTDAGSNPCKTFIAFPPISFSYYLIFSYKISVSCRTSQTAHHTAQWTYLLFQL